MTEIKDLAVTLSRGILKETPYSFWRSRGPPPGIFADPGCKKAKKFRDFVSLIKPFLE